MKYLISLTYIAFGWGLTPVASGQALDFAGFVDVKFIPKEKESGFFPYDSPFEHKPVDPQPPARKRYKPIGTSMFYGPYFVWNRYLTKIDGPKCPHYPTCSHFGFQAVKKHGAKGVIYTVSRLFYAEAGDLESYGFYEYHIRNGVGRIYDPVEDYESLETNKIRHIGH